MTLWPRSGESEAEATYPQVSTNDCTSMLVTSLFRQQSHAAIGGHGFGCTTAHLWRHTIKLFPTLLGVLYIESAHTLCQLVGWIFPFLSDKSCSSSSSSDQNKWHQSSYKLLMALLYLVDIRANRETSTLKVPAPLEVVSPSGWSPGLLTGLPKQAWLHLINNLPRRPASPSS